MLFLIEFAFPPPHPSVKEFPPPGGPFLRGYHWSRRRVILGRPRAFSKRRRFISKIWPVWIRVKRSCKDTRPRIHHWPCFCLWYCIQYWMFGTGPLDYLYHIFVTYCCFAVSFSHGSKPWQTASVPLLDNTHAFIVQQSVAISFSASRTVTEKFWRFVEQSILFFATVHLWYKGPRAPSLCKRSCSNKTHPSRPSGSQNASRLLGLLVPKPPHSHYLQRTHFLWATHPPIRVLPCLPNLAQGARGGLSR
jgi:hypothetical protein